MSEQFKYKSNTGEDRRQALLTEYMVREQARRDKEALLDLLGSESGRWFLMRMLDVTKVNSMCFTGNSKTFYNEGRRDVGLGIIKSINITILCFGFFMDKNEFQIYFLMSFLFVISL